MLICPVAGSKVTVLLSYKKSGTITESKFNCAIEAILGMITAYTYTVFNIGSLFMLVIVMSIGPE